MLWQMQGFSCLAEPAEMRMLRWNPIWQVRWTMIRMYSAVITDMRAASVRDMEMDPAKIIIATEKEKYRKRLLLSEDESGFFIFGNISLVFLLY